MAITIYVLHLKIQAIITGLPVVASLLFATNYQPTLSLVSSLVLNYLGYLIFSFWRPSVSFAFTTK